jgi:hypothetical protein
MSISLRQLSAMADIAEALAAEMRELIALREIVAIRSADQARGHAGENDFRPNTEAPPAPGNIIPDARCLPA